MLWQWIKLWGSCQPAHVFTWWPWLRRYCTCTDACLMPLASCPQQQQHPSTAGTGLLGGQAIGSAPAPQGAQTAYAQAGTGAYAYQQF